VIKNPLVGLLCHHRTLHDDSCELNGCVTGFCNFGKKRGQNIEAQGHDQTKYDQKGRRHKHQQQNSYIRRVKILLSQNFILNVYCIYGLTQNELDAVKFNK